jgi:hypothetical protein
MSKSLDKSAAIVVNQPATQWRQGAEGQPFNSNSRPKGPLGLKRDDEAIWGNLPKTRTNRRRIALPVVRSPALGDADVYEGRFGATLYLQAICGDRELPTVQEQVINQITLQGVT